jgi:hypothetical protein
MFTVVGKSGDNVPVTNVLVSVNSGAWTPATLLNNGSNWTEQVTLTPGENTVAAYAVGVGGNCSKTNTVKDVDFILTTTLTVSTNGKGSISPNYNGKSLQINESYKMTAKAAKGFTFTSWTDGFGDVITTKAALEFVMASNLTFVANFVSATEAAAGSSGAKSVLANVSPQPPLKFSNDSGNLMVTNGKLLMNLSGPVGTNVVVESSTDLLHWVPVQTNTVPVGGLPLMVPANLQPVQFIRARIQQ